jgi:hypothetical protein
MMLMTVLFAALDGVIALSTGGCRPHKTDPLVPPGDGGDHSIRVGSSTAILAASRIPALKAILDHVAVGVGVVMS